MTSASKAESGGFKYLWKIENFSKCVLENGECLTSPKFIVDDLYKSAWYLNLFPRGISDEKYLECLLVRDSADYGPSLLNIRYAIYLITTDEREQDLQTELKKGKFKHGDDSSFYCYHLLTEIFENRSVFLPRGTLSILCYIQKECDEDCKTPTVECTAKSRISVERIHFTWNINNLFSHFRTFSREITYATKYKCPPPITMKLHFQGEERDLVNVNMSKNKNKPIFVSCRLRLVDAHKKLHEFSRGEHFFGSQDTKWTLSSPISRKLSKNDCVFVNNNTLSIHCEFEVSYGIVMCEVEELKILPPPSESKTVGGPNPLMFDLRSMYVDQKLCDVSFKVSGNKTLRAHKLILCARSPVFSAMFDTDMKEISDNCVVVDDLDYDTLDGMFRFLYTDALEEGTGFESVLKLYEAADKYQIMSLSEACLLFLGSRISEKNFCDVLVVADLHQEERLMNAAKDFMFGHLQEIMKWDAWKGLMENNFVLAVETLRQVLNRATDI